MEDSRVSFRQLAATAKRLAQRLLLIGQNRLELLALEAQEERLRLVQALLLALGVAVLGLLAAITLTGAVVVLFWSLSPLATLLVLTGLYGAGAVILYRRLATLLRDWQNFPATLDQFRKDRAGLEKLLG